MQRAHSRTLTLPLCGHTVSLNLAEMVAFDPSAEDGALQRATVRRGVESCARHGTPLANAASAPNRTPVPTPALPGDLCLDSSFHLTNPPKTVQLNR